MSLLQSPAANVVTLVRVCRSWFALRLVRGRIVWRRLGGR